MSKKVKNYQINIGKIRNLIKGIQELTYIQIENSFGLYIHNTLHIIFNIQFFLWKGCLTEHPSLLVVAPLLIKMIDLYLIECEHDIFNQG